jgi:alpha-tubulin suppressor-like RCC1 family protein
MVVMSADDEMHPVLAFTSGLSFNSVKVGDPLKDVLDHQTRLRLRELRGTAVRNSFMAAKAAAAKQRWKLLLESTSATVGPSVATTNIALSDVRVAPFILSSWNQWTANGNSNGPACYNYYTPPYAPGSSSNDVCGCVATAFSQVIRYWQYPTNSVGTASFSIQIQDAPTYANLLGGDGHGGPYQWNLMPLAPDAAIQPAQAQAIGALTHDVGLLAGMDYNSNFSGASDATAVSNLVKSFGYSNGIDLYSGGNSFGADSIASIITPSLNAKCPVVLAITGDVGGHAVVCDGYGYYNGSLYHHLNFGWGGDDNVWYFLPTENTDKGNFNIVDELSFNIFPKGSGEIISGRVTDTDGTPLAGTTVSASLNQTRYSALTDSNGIYAIYPVPANSTFQISASLSGITAPSTTQIATTHKSVSGTALPGYSNTGAAGSVSGIDFQMTVTNRMIPSLGTFTIPVQTLGPTQVIINPPSSPSSGSFSYSSGNPAVADVIGNVLILKGAGTATITANQAASGMYQSATTTAQLVVVQALIGQPFYLPTTLSGQAPLSYQWYRNNRLLASATSPILNLGVLNANSGGYYSVKVTDANSRTSLQGTFVLPGFATSLLTAWGGDTNGNLSVPLGLTNAVAVSAGANHSMAVSRNETVTSWGDNTYGQASIPSGLTNVVQVSAATYHSLALMSDGKVVSWGTNYWGILDVPQGLSNVIAVSAGTSFSLALLDNGTVSAWGNTIASNGSPAIVPTGCTNVTAIAAGCFHALALKSDGTVVAWGDNTYGQTNVPAGLTNVVAIAAGNNTSLALTASGQVMAWGQGGSWGQTNVPTGLTNAVAVSASPYFYCEALTASGTPIPWGYHALDSQATPANLGSVSSIAAGGYFALALQGVQSLASFMTIPSQTYSNGATVSITPPTASSSLPVTVTVKSGPATIAGNTVTLTGAGTVVLAANQSGNANYLAASEVTTSFSVAQSSQTIAPFSPISGHTYGDASFSVTAPTASSGLPVVLSVLSGPAMISGNKVTLTGVGTVVLAANQAGNANYTAASEVITSFSVAQGNQTITFGALTNRTYGSAPFTLNATASSGLTVSYSSSSTNIAVASNMVTILGAGTATITASQTGNTNWSTATPVNQNLVIAQASNTIVAFATIPSQTYSNGATVTITPPAAASSLPVVVTVKSGPATINGNTVTLTGAGTVVLAANQSGNANYLAASEVTTSFSEAQGNQTITFPAIANQPISTNPIILIGSASSGLPISFSVLSGSASMLSSNALTLSGIGTITIQASQTGNTNWSAATPVRQSFVVSKGSQNISFAPFPTNTYGQSPYPVTNASASSGLPVTYTSSVAGVASILSNTLTIVGAGTTTITAAQPGNTNWNAATAVTQKLVVAKASNSISAFTSVPNPIYESNGIVSLPKPLPVASSGLPVTLSVKSGPAVMSGTNAVKITGAGVVMLAANQSGNANYLPAGEVITNFQILQATQSLAAFTTIPNKTNGVAPFAVTLPKASSGLPVSLSVLSGHATLSNSTVTLTGAGMVLLAANQVGNTNYLAAPQVTTSFSVAKGSQTITLPALASVTTGTTPFRLGATASSGLPVSYNSASTNITLSSNTVTILGAGTATITANQSGNADWNAATSALRTLVVTAPAVSTGSVTNQIGGIGLASGMPTTSVRPSSFPLIRPSNKGSVVAWGNSTYSQTNVPAGLTNIVQLSTWGLHSLALRTNGSVVAWGWNPYGQATVPTSVTNAVQVAAGVSFSAALRANGTVIAWGDNSLGQKNVPAGLTNAVQIATGSDHTLALLADGSVIGWGWNDYGQTSVPADATNVVQVAAGYLHSAVLKADGTVEAWGDNTYGETNVPAGLTNIVRIATGLSHTVALKGDGTVVVWGWNNAGQTNVPRGLSGVSQIASGGNTVFAVTTNGTLVTWGDNSYGQRKPPAGLTNVMQFVIALYHGLGLKR